MITYFKTTDSRHFYRTDDSNFSVLRAINLANTSVIVKTVDNEEKYNLAISQSVNGIIVTEVEFNSILSQNISAVSN